MNVEPITASPYQRAKQKFNQIRTAQPLEKFYSAVKNSADLNDTIVVPRTIFKGYLSIMAGTVLATLGLLMSKSFQKTSKVLSSIGTLVTMYGTYAFVRPYVIKDAPGVSKQKAEETKPVG